MLTTSEIEELYIANYYYSFGLEYLSDTVYENRMNVLRAEAPNHPLLTTHYSQQPVPFAILQKYGIPLIENKLADCILELELPPEIEALRLEYLSNYEGRFEDTSQKSIELIQDYEKIEERLENFEDEILHASIKADGQNFTAAYLHGKLCYGRTKGRSGNPLEITKVLRLVLPTELEVLEGEPIEELKIMSGELVCYKSSLPYLKANYKQQFKMPRSAVSSLLRGGLSLEDIRNHLKPLVFKVRSEYLHTLEEEFAWAKAHGFNTPIALTFQYSWENLMKVFEYFTPMRENLPYANDGVVIGINNNNAFYAQGSGRNYYCGNIACKVGVWNPGYYTGYVLDIVWSYGETVLTPEAIIEPVTISTGADVTSIPCDHLGRLIEHHILPGSEIYFKITGDAKITLVHREEELETMHAHQLLHPTQRIQRTPITFPTQETYNL